MMRLLFIYFFFFQAEDGIRDRNVTGVQTCALPIWANGHRAHLLVPISKKIARSFVSFKQSVGHTSRSHNEAAPECLCRSEERRVGKECRSGWLAYYWYKNKYI